MWSLYKRGEVWWSYWRGNERISTQCRDRAAAEAWCRDRERRATDPDYAAAQETTLAAGVRLFLAHCTRRGRSKATLAFYATKLGHAVRLLGADLALERITAAAVDGYLDARRAEDSVLTEHTLAKELGAVRAMLRVLRRRGLYHRDPATVLPVAFEARYAPRTTALSPAELDRLLLALTPDRAAAVAYAVATAARRSELFRAERGDWDRAAGLVLLRGTKTARSARHVAVLRLFEPLLERAMRDAPGKTGRLFESWQNARRDIHRACERAQVPLVSWNDLRRTHGRWLRARGVEPALIGEQLRHASSRMAEQVYAKPSPAELRALIEDRLDAQVVRPTGPRGKARRG